MSGYRVGLTGGVASGKSTIASMLGDLGAGLVDADQLVHELTAPAGAAIAELRNAFGPSAIAADGGLDRAWMRARAFADAGARQRLEGILHPRVREEAERRAQALVSKVPYVVLVVPLLVESGNWKSRVQRVLVVDCAETTQLERVMTRPGIDRATATAIIRSQVDRHSRLAVADDVLFNEAPIAVMRDRVARLHDYYVRSAESGSEHAGM